MTYITQETVYTIQLSKEDLNKLNNNSSFEVKINKTRVIIKRGEDKSWMDYKLQY